MKIFDYTDNFEGRKAVLYIKEQVEKNKKPFHKFNSLVKKWTDILENQDLIKYKDEFFKDVKETCTPEERIQYINQINAVIGV